MNIGSGDRYRPALVRVCFSATFRDLFQLTRTTPDRSATMPIDLYCHPALVGTRAVLMTAKSVGVEVIEHHIDLRKGEQFAPEFLAINPLHTIPTLVDNGLVLTESRAIMVYLVEKYGKPDDPLYPRDVQRRAIVNHRLFFDVQVLNNFHDYYAPRLFLGAKEFVAEDFKKIENSLALFEKYLEGKWFAAGDNLTLADIALVATMSGYVHPEGFRLGKAYPNVTRWFNKCKEVVPHYNVNILGIREYKTAFAALKA